MCPQFLLLLVTLAVALTTLDVVDLVILLPLVVTAQHLVVLVQTALPNMLVGMVVMDQVVT
tara:strand:+ start:109 stop:291 length:183 start_codon:yes stop_codon:yes gene_type:complete